MTEYHQIKCDAPFVVTSSATCACPVGKVEFKGACVDTCPNGQIADEANVCTPALPKEGCTTCGGTNPVSVPNGKKYQVESLYAGAGGAFQRLGLSYLGQRTDDSITPVRNSFGAVWISSWQTRIFLAGRAGSATQVANVLRPDGREFQFVTPSSGNVWTTQPDVNHKLEQLVDGGGAPIGWRFTDANNNNVEIYDMDGRVLSVTTPQGLTRKFSYADGANGLLYGTTPSATGYTAPACSPPSGWAYQFNPNFPVQVVMAPEPGLLLCVSDAFGRQFHFQYDSAQRIIRAADPSQGQYVFEYDGASGGCVGGSPSGACTAKNLTKVTYADGTSRTYVYNEASAINGGNPGACSGVTVVGSGLGHLPNQLTAIIDENGNRYAEWTYDCVGRATSSKHIAGSTEVDKVLLTYDTPALGQTTVVNYAGPASSPLSTTRVYAFSTIQGLAKNTGVVDPATSQPAPCLACGNAGEMSYDANANRSSQTDWNGNKTCSAYDTGLNLETRRVEGLGSSATCSTYLTGTPTLSGVQRMTSTTWSSDWRLPTSIAEPLRITTYTYGAPSATNPGDRGNVLTISVQATLDATGAAGFGATTAGSPRVTTYTYNANGQVLTVNGPRTDVTDVTTYTYYANNDSDLGKRGNVATVTNALSQTTQITAYNAHGQPTTIVDPNGLTTTLAYDSRQRLTSREVGSEITTYTYDNAGQLTQVTLPDSSSVSYTYDPAHRLTAIQDNLGNKISYALDLLGNRTQEQIFDPANTLAQTRSRVYNALSRLTQEIGAASQTTGYAYDLQGNLTTVTDPRSQVTTNTYDALNRLATMTQPVPTVGQSAPVIAYGYNGLDHLTQVTDPRSLVTSYAYDGLGNMNTQVSPDTGTTTNTYDLAGNILTSTDAKSQVTTYTYDAANRVASIVYNQATGTQLKTVAYTYDQGTNGLGRLTTVTESDGNAAALQTTQYAYDQRGRLITETRTLAGNTSPYVTGYTYDPTSGRLLIMTYPSGRTVSYSYDALGRISQIGSTAPAAQGGQTQLLVTNVTYQPFGGVKSFTRGNNRTVTRSYDQDGRIASYTLGGTSITVGYDAASRITSLLDTVNAANSNAYGYDNLDRLTSASVPATSYSYAYDATGNRLSRSAGSATDLTTISNTSNRITQVAGSATRTYTYDNNGSTTADGNNTYTYDPRGRLIQTVSGAGTTTYQVSSQGQRVRKTSSLGDTVFHYDAQGKLIAETSPSGQIRKEYFYLLDIPVAVSAPQ